MPLWPVVNPNWASIVKIPKEIIKWINSSRWPQELRDTSSNFFCRSFSRTRSWFKRMTLAGLFIVSWSSFQDTIYHFKAFVSYFLTFFHFFLYEVFSEFVNFWFYNSNLNFSRLLYYTIFFIEQICKVFCPAIRIYVPTSSLFSPLPSYSAISAII